MNFFAFPLTKKPKYSRVYLHMKKAKYKIVEKRYGRFLRISFRCIRNNPGCKHFRFFKESRMKWSLQLVLDLLFFVFEGPSNLFKSLWGHFALHRRRSWLLNKVHKVLRNPVLPCSLSSPSITQTCALQSNHIAQPSQALPYPLQNSYSHLRTISDKTSRRPVLRFWVR